MNLSRKNDAKIVIRHRYGVNRRITGEYDTDLAVKCRNGVFVGGKTGDVIAFKGIPFAKQPTGELRWKAPERAGVILSSGRGLPLSQHMGEPHRRQDG